MLKRSGPINEGVREGKEIGEEMQMTGIISRCNICGKFFDSKKDLRKHKDKNHRVTNSKMVTGIRISEEKNKQYDIAVKRNHYEELAD